MKNLLYIASALLLALPATTTAAILPVGATARFKTLRDAIAKASPTDTIMVNPGTYREGNILVTKSLTIIGHQYPVLDGIFRDEIITVAAPNVTIDGLRIIRSGRSSMNDLAGIKCLDAHYVHIKNNIFEDTFFAIHLSNTDYSVITGNKLRSTAEFEYQLGNGIHLWKCNYANIISNTIEGHRDGIYLEFATHSNIRKNSAINNIRYGLHFMFSHENLYEDNLFRNNGAGVAVMYTRKVKMIRNIFEHNRGTASYGMLLKDITDSEVYNNRFLNNTVGIYMEGTSRSTFSSNKFSDNGWALKLMASCDNNHFTNNNFISNTFDISTNGNTVLNSISKNYWDKYSGYDLNKDGMGDVPFHPVNLFSMITETVPSSILLWRSFLVFLLDQAEKVIPVITPADMKDIQPVMRPYDLR